MAWPVIGCLFHFMNEIVVIWLFIRSAVAELITIIPLCLCVYMCHLATYLLDSYVRQFLASCMHMHRHIYNDIIMLFIVMKLLHCYDVIMRPLCSCDITAISLHNNIITLLRCHNSVITLSWQYDDIIIWVLCHGDVMFLWHHNDIISSYDIMKTLLYHCDNVMMSLHYNGMTS